jgi:hypothetical protein
MPEPRRTCQRIHAHRFARREIGSYAWFADPLDQPHRNHEGPLDHAAEFVFSDRGDRIDQVLALIWWASADPDH